MFFRDLRMNLLENVSTVRNAYITGVTKSIKFRLSQLKALLRLYEDNTEAMVTALAEDMSKSKQEAIISEIDYLINDVRTMLRNLPTWSKPKKPNKPLINLLDQVIIEKEPYGVVLIISAWNYPLQLAFAPLSGAIAAGNCAIIKPSEIAPACSKLIAHLVPQYLDKNCYRVVEGGIFETSELLKLKFDFIFFTGSTHTGKIVQEAAAKFLTPTTLELGGKSPVFIDSSADIEIAVKRIMWGKCFNAGQTCIAPDYVLCTKKIQKQFVDMVEQVLNEWYGTQIDQSPDYARIINVSHFKRLIRLLENAKIAYGGNSCITEKYIQPTVLIDVAATDLVMQEEIFGPILPILNVNNVDEAIDFINAKEKPLALYIFSNNQKTINLFRKNTSCGGITVNDTLMHFSCDSLPFGGVGNSGLGAYHGKFSFNTFSHKKSILIKSLNKLGENLQNSRYPPYSDKKIKFLTSMTKRKARNGPNYLLYIAIYLLGAVTSVTIAYVCNFIIKKQ